MELHQICSENFIKFLSAKWGLVTENIFEDIKLEYAPAVLEYILLYNYFDEEYIFYFDVDIKGSSSDEMKYIIVMSNPTIRKIFTKNIKEKLY